MRERAKKKKRRRRRKPNYKYDKLLTLDALKKDSFYLKEKHDENNTKKMSKTHSILNMCA